MLRKHLLNWLSRWRFCPEMRVVGLLHLVPRKEMLIASRRKLREKCLKANKSRKGRMGLGSFQARELHQKHLQGINMWQPVIFVTILRALVRKESRATSVSTIMNTRGKGGTSFGNRDY